MLFFKRKKFTEVLREHLQRALLIYSFFLLGIMFAFAVFRIFHTDRSTQKANPNVRAVARRDFPLPESGKKVLKMSTTSVDPESQTIFDFEKDRLSEVKN